MLIPGPDIEAAAARIRAHLAPTPLVHARHFSRKLGANVFFKLETLQPTHFEIVSHHVYDLVTVSDDSAMQSLLEILEKEKLLTEPAASCSVAALAEGKIALRAGENVVVVLCGANITLENVRSLGCRHSSIQITLSIIHTQ